VTGRVKRTRSAIILNNDEETLMKNSWTRTFRRLAAGVAIGSATAFASAMCYAQSAYDDASDGAYADGWQAGDNGGFGFTPWNFDAGYIYQGTNYTYASAGFKAIDDGLQSGTQLSNPHNSIGRAWTIGSNPNLATPEDPNDSTDDGAPHVGRGFSPLEINQTLKVVIDNPSARRFFKGYFVRLNGGSGGTNGNICNFGYGCSHPNFPDGYPVAKMGWDRFEYFSYGEWSIDDAASNSTGVFDTDTAAAGALIKVTRTAAEKYKIVVDSFGGGADFSASRTFNNPGPEVDWIEFVFFNTPSDLDPTLAEPGTDFYIRSMRISVPEPGAFGLLVLGAGTLLGIGSARRRKD
jgi:hypothetical protein